MSKEITVRDLIDRLGDGPQVLVRGMVWRVVGARQQTDATDGTMRVQLRLTRQDPQDPTPRKTVLEVELYDTITLVDEPAA